MLPQKAGQELRIGLRTGEKKLYVIKDIRGFLAASDENEVLQLGKEFTYQPEWMRYTDDDMRVLDILRKLCSLQEPGIRAGNPAANRLMRLPDPFAKELLDLDGDTVLVLHNPSRNSQSVDLSAIGDFGTLRAVVGMHGASLSGSKLEIEGQTSVVLR